MKIQAFWNDVSQGFTIGIRSEPMTEIIDEDAYERYALIFGFFFFDIVLSVPMNSNENE